MCLIAVNRTARFINLADFVFIGASPFEHDIGRSFGRCKCPEQLSDETENKTGALPGNLSPGVSQAGEYLDDALESERIILDVCLAQGAPDEVIQAAKIL